MSGITGGSTVACERCHRSLQIGPELGGQTVACPYCGHQFLVQLSVVQPPIALPSRIDGEHRRADVQSSFRAHYILAATATALGLTIVGIVIGRSSAPGGSKPTLSQSVSNNGAPSDNKQLVRPKGSGKASQVDFATVAERFSRLGPRALPELKQVGNVRFDVSTTNSVTAPLRAQLQFDAMVETIVWIPKSENVILPVMRVSAKIRYVAEYALLNDSWQFSGTVASTWQSATLVQDLEATRNTPLARQTKVRVESWLKRELVGRSFQHDAELITVDSRDDFRAQANAFTPSQSIPLSPDTSENGQTYPELYDILQFLNAVSNADVEQRMLPLYTPTFASRSKLAEEGSHEERLAAAGDLGSMGRQAIPVLAELALAPDVQQGNFGAQDDGLRIAAIQSLVKIGPESIPTLLKCLDDQSPSVQDEAATALASFGAKSAVAIPKLQVIVKTRNPGFGGNGKIATSIRRIDPNAVVPAQPKLRSELPTLQ